MERIVSLQTTSSTELQAYLLDFARRLRALHAYVGVSCEGRIATASVGHNSSHTDVTDPGRFPAGCLTKLLTAALVDLEIVAGHFDLATRIDKLLGIPGTQPFCDITIHHLLDHTHGLDDSAIFSAPLQPDGLINVEALAGHLSVRTTLPGARYSYSNVGTWLLCAILEHTYQTPIGELLRARLFRPNGMAHALAATSSTSALCGSAGQFLPLSVRDLLQFMQLVLERRTPLGFCGRSRSSLEAEVRTLPGWTPVEVGMRLGWKYYDNGWFGHSSDLPRMPAHVRLNPDLRMSIVIASETHSPFTLAAALFGHLLPGVFTVRTPTLLTPREEESINLEPYIGEFRNAGFRIITSRTGGSALAVEVADRRSSEFGSGTNYSAPLVSAKGGIFLLRTPRADIFRYLQFPPPNAGRVGYLWNGRWTVPQWPT